MFSWQITHVHPNRVRMVVPVMFRVVVTDALVLQDMLGMSAKLYNVRHVVTEKLTDFISSRFE